MAAERQPIDWATLPLDSEIYGRSLTMSLNRVLAFSGGPFDEPGWPQRNLHTDADKAREAGLDGIIASGTQSEGLLLGFLLDLFGASWYDGGELDVRFLKPVRVNDAVRPAVRLRSRERIDARLRLALDCRCETASGERVIEGSVLVTLASEARVSGR